MTVKDALGVIIDLASDTTLDAADAKDYGLLDQYYMQQAAMSIVLELWSNLDECQEV